MARALASAVALVLLVGCGGDAPAPTAPSPPPPPNYQGVWAGAWQSLQCSIVNSTTSCAQAPAFGSLRLTLAQTGTSVSGSVEVGNTLTPVTGFVGTDGALVVSGQGSLADGTLNISEWRTTMASNIMSGSFTIRLIAPDGSGAIIRAGLSGVSKTS